MGSTESSSRLTAGLVIVFLLAVLAAAGYPLLRSPALPSLASSITTTTVSDSSILAAQHEIAAQVQYRAEVASWHAQQVAAARPKVTVAAPIVTPPPAPAPSYTPATAAAGAYSYAGLEQLWVANGGSVATEATAACIAEHESSGVASAFNGRDIGLWQIDPGHDPNGDLYNANENARIAVQVSADGTNWSQWTTAPDCGV